VRHSEEFGGDDETPTVRSRKRALRSALDCLLHKAPRALIDRRRAVAFQSH